MTISFNPSLTTSPQNNFLAQTQGYIQGFFQSDPAVALQLKTGLIAAAVTQPVWGGIALQELVPTADAFNTGNTLALATSEATTTGFSVFNHGSNLIIVPGSNNVPVASAGMSMPYFSLGSNAQIAVLCSSALITAVEGNGVNTQVQWDYTNQQLIPFASGTALPVTVVAVSALSKGISYNSGTGAVTWTAPANIALIQI